MVAPAFIAGLRHRLAHLWSDCRGVVAIESAFTLPILMAIFLGLIEMHFALEAKRKVATAAALTADLIGQNETLTAAEITSIFQATGLMLQPLDADVTNLDITIASYRYDLETGGAVTPTAFIDWRQTQGTLYDLDGPPQCNPAHPQWQQPWRLDASGACESGQSFIYVGVQYVYTSPINWLLGTFTVTEQAFATPRLTRFIDCADCIAP